ncbi:hypothetical protein KXD40_008053 [Peronospora effusa]|uniref:Uncharacterized protein n=1 Tax=Peronospora effusa TaxID=542832 RepID=A0A3R7XMY6_9STRA|nr:hypothetical protein DD237_006547 [Peronospora effusa]UIZ24263.1 hypothetical protein KXD40_008053 [Peronospora effusa]
MNRSAEDVAQKAPSTAKQVESEWLRLRTVVELLIRNRGWITDSDHFAELLTRLRSTESVRAQVPQL